MAGCNTVSCGAAACLPAELKFRWAGGRPTTCFHPPSTKHTNDQPSCGFAVAEGDPDSHLNLLACLPHCACLPRSACPSHPSPARSTSNQPTTPLRVPSPCRFAVAEGDLISYLNVWRAWEESGRSKKWAVAHRVMHRNLLRAADIRNQARPWGLRGEEDTTGSSLVALLESSQPLAPHPA